MKDRKLFEIRNSGIHGKGGFALEDIPAGARVAEYVGERIGKEESAKRCEAQNPYIFYIDEEWDIDGDVEGNPARFINHSCAPNTEAQCEDGRVWLIALRDIKKEEELSFDYGYDLENYEEHPCVCGAAKCRGYILGEAYELPGTIG